MKHFKKKNKPNKAEEKQLDEPLQEAAENDAYTEQEVQEIVDEVVATPSPKRVWEVDFLRGFMILFVVWDHFMWDIHNLGPYQTGFFQWLYNLSNRYYSGALRLATHDVFVALFVFTSGISCSFSRSNGKRALKMVSFALLFTAVTMALSSILGTNLTIRFNVIHVIALSVLLWTGIEWIWARCRKNWHKNLFGVIAAAVTITALVVGACANTSTGAWESQSSFWFFLANHKGSPEFGKFTGGDYLPFLPSFGYFLLGAFLGRCLYREKKSLFPSVNAKWVSPITFCGRYSIWIYFGSQVVMYGLLYLLADIVNVI